MLRDTKTIFCGDIRYDLGITEIQKAALLKWSRYNQNENIHLVTSSIAATTYFNLNKLRIASSSNFVYSIKCYLEELMGSAHLIKAWFLSSVENGTNRKGDFNIHLMPVCMCAIFLYYIF